MIDADKLTEDEWKRLRNSGAVQFPEVSKKEEDDGLHYPCPDPGDASGVSDEELLAFMFEDPATADEMMEIKTHEELVDKLIEVRWDLYPQLNREMLGLDVPEPPDDEDHPRDDPPSQKAIDNAFDVMQSYGLD